MSWPYSGKSEPEPAAEFHVVTVEKHSEVDMATIRPSEVDQTKKKAAVKLPLRRGRSTRRPDADEGHMGATENQMVPTLPPLPDDDEPKQG